jgi:hypothetical protein
LIIDGVAIAAGAGIIALLGHEVFGDGDLSIPQQVFLLLAGILSAVVARVIGRACFA